MLLCIDFFFFSFFGDFFFRILPIYLYLCCQTPFICFKNFYFSLFYSFFLHTDLSGQYQNLLRLLLWNLVSFAINFEKFFFFWLSSIYQDFSIWSKHMFKGFLNFFGKVACLRLKPGTSRWNANFHPLRQLTFIKFSTLHVLIKKKKINA